MSNHVQIAAATELDIYFSDPHSPWQRGSNENINSLLRQYFPKSTDLAGYRRNYLDFVASELNRRPRKRLSWRTPAEALDQLLSNPQTSTQCCVDRLNKPQVRLPRGHEPGPHRHGPQTLVQPMEESIERIRDHLRRTPVRRQEVNTHTIQLHR
jgi:hypothetical protein